MYAYEGEYGCHILIYARKYTEAIMKNVGLLIIICCGFISNRSQVLGFISNRSQICGFISNRSQICGFISNRSQICGFIATDD